MKERKQNSFENTPLMIVSTDTFSAGWKVSHHGFSNRILDNVELIDTLTGKQTTKIKVFSKKSFHYQNDFIERLAQEGINYPGLINNIIQDSKAKLSGLKNFENSFKNNLIDTAQIAQNSHKSIELNTHMVYVFKDSSGRISTSNNEAIIRSTKALNLVNPNYTHKFWTNNFNNLNEEIKCLENIEIVDISEFTGHVLYKYVEEFLTKAAVPNEAHYKAFLTQASDLIRIMALEKFGGIYHDVDYQIFEPEILDYLTTKYNLLLGQESEDQRDIANNFIAVSKNHQVIKDMINLVVRNLEGMGPEYVYHAISPSNKLVYEHGPSAFSVPVFHHFQKALEGKIENDFMFFPIGGFTNYEMARKYLSFFPADSCFAYNSEGLNLSFNATMLIKIDESTFSITTIGADPLSAGWTDSESYDKVIEYFQVVTDSNGKELECSSGRELPKHLEPSTFVLQLMGEQYECGYIG